MRVPEEEQRAGRTPAGIDPGLAAEVIVRGGSQVIARQVSNSDDSEDAVVAREPARSYWCGVYRRPEA
ncbi:hypothetical protein AB0L10_09915 [Streptomyces flaveolus]|uniref:hypothetical protein n=1 Tax=Streptomyces flaveolus TaxID=67297 RepID=UPI003449F530